MAQRVVIVGAGPAGLAAAYRLQGHRDVQVTLIEKEAEVGGRNRSLELAPGFFADDSAQFFSRDYSHTFGLMKELGIFRKLEEIDVRRFSGIYRDGRISDLPAGLLGLARPGILSWRETAAVLRWGIDIALRYRPGALYRPGRLEREDATRLSDYVRRRYGEAFLGNIVEPLAAMMMGRAEQLSLVPITSMSRIAATRHYALPAGNGEFTRSLASACSGARLGTKVRRIVVDQGSAAGAPGAPEASAGLSRSCLLSRHPAAQSHGALGAGLPAAAGGIQHSTARGRGSPRDQRLPEQPADRGFGPPRRRGRASSRERWEAPMKSVLAFIKGPAFFRVWLMWGVFLFGALSIYLAAGHSTAYGVGMVLLWMVWYWETSTGICASCRHFGTMHCAPQGPFLARILTPRDGPVPRYRFYLHELLNLAIILAPQPLLWQRPALAILANLWVALAVVAGIPYSGASWLASPEERESWPKPR